jgi:hypothetical protein
VLLLNVSSIDLVLVLTSMIHFVFQFFVVMEVHSFSFLVKSD